MGKRANARNNQYVNTFYCCLLKKDKRLKDQKVNRLVLSFFRFVVQNNPFDSSETGFKSNSCNFFREDHERAALINTDLSLMNLPIKLLFFLGGGGYITPW